MEYFEDLEVGETARVGEVTVTAEDIKRFGERYDPQPFHVDEDAAAASMFGGLVASGWHTASLTMRLLVDGQLSESRALGAVGVDELRFRAPVRPGDVLTAETEILDTEVWDDERGLVHVGVQTSNETEPVLSMTGLILWERR